MLFGGYWATFGDCSVAAPWLFNGCLWQSFCCVRTGLVLSRAKWVLVGRCLGATLAPSSVTRLGRSLGAAWEGELVECFL
eukprot:8743657-Lingulodinium_polyedra.AAC.1